jgi:DNA-binding transcriptional LysR family regulator
MSWVPEVSSLILLNTGPPVLVMDSRFERANIKTDVLGQERYVVIASAKRSLCDDVFLDNSPTDRATESFFGFQGKKVPKYRRAYFDDCYGIIDGVALGLGRAVMPRHLIKNIKDIRVVEGYKSYAVDVVLHYYQQPFYSKMHQAVIKQLTSYAARYL